MSRARESLRGKLPLELPRPEFDCPICGARVFLTEVTEWGADEGEILTASFDCETEPDIDSDEWWDWHRGHYRMPYVDWLPFEVRALEWINGRYYYGDEEAR